MTQGKLLHPRLKRHVGKYRKSQLTGAEIHQKKPLRKAVPALKTLNESDEFLEAQ